MEVQRRLESIRVSQNVEVTTPPRTEWQESKLNVAVGLTLQRHFRVLTKFAHVESRLSGHKRQREVVFYASVNLCDRRACAASVAVGLIGPKGRRWLGVY